MNLSAAWYIGFSVTDTETGVTIRKQYRGGINLEKDLKARLKAAEAVRSFWENELKSGWSPFDYKEPSPFVKMTFNDALDFALERCQVATKTKLDYTCTVNFFKEAAEKKALSESLITGITRQHIRLLLEYIQKERNWSNHAYNKNLGYLAGILSRLVDFEIIENNPAHKIKTLPVAETQMYEPITSDERILIRNHLTKVHPAFFTYVMCIFSTGIRPKEVLALKISDLQLTKNLIVIKPDLDQENSKTKTIRMVPVDEHLSALLQNHIKGYHQSMYVFGAPGASGRGNSGMKAENPEYFLPSNTHIKRDTATKLWKKIVMDTLGIQKYLYALKHTGADSKILAGIPIEALKDMYGHTSVLMTEKYARKIKEVHRDKIIKSSPDF